MTVCYPVLETETIHYSVQPGCGFLDDAYFNATKQVHPAIDLNATTGRDTDYGNRIRACAEGVIVAAGEFRSWGGIVLIHHPELAVWSQYAHLFGITVRKGQQVRMGDMLGQMGKGESNQFWAHLHFEIRRSLLPADFWPSRRFPGSKAAAEAFIREHYLDPQAWLTEHGALRSFAEAEQVRRSWSQAPVVVPRQEAPPAVSVQSIPPLPANAQGMMVLPLYNVPGYDRVRLMKRTDGTGLKAYGVKVGKAVTDE